MFYKNKWPNCNHLELFVAVPPNNHDVQLGIISVGGGGGGGKVLNN